MLRFKKYYPKAKLNEYVHYYFVIDMDGNPEANGAGNSFLSNHPQGTFDLMFALRGGIQLSNFKNEVFELSQIFVMAQQEGYFNIQFEPKSYIFGVVFYAESFSKLFNFPLSELTNTGKRVDDHLSSAYREIHEQLQQAYSEALCVQLMDDFIERQLSQVDFSFSKFDELIRSIRLGNGNSNIKELSNEANMSERTMQRKMKDQLGIGPKSFSNVIRFKEVLRYINEHPEHDWQDILFQCGYYDQAHFIKDFKKHTGKTPSVFTREQLNLSNLFLDD